MTHQQPPSVLRWTHRASQGFTLVELLIAILLFGVVITLVARLTASQNKMNSVLLEASNLTDDARLANMRLTELLAQASYIYPENQTITLPSGSVTTGKQALAFLLASGTPYCSAASTTYCAVLYRIEPRSTYVSILGNNSLASGSVITEANYISMSWGASDAGNYPSRNWSGLTLVGGVAGLVVDSVDTALTDLGSNLTVATRSSGYDEGLKKNVVDTDPGALIQAATPTIALKYSNGRKAQTQFSVYAQPIPRQGPLDN